ncbi:MAG TPA: DUF937 domain-containing protein [Gemmatimonadales bacterium]|jgi:hypothetical protein|nr:DUF937 domain-containing protein [Gemmatimonadales bacterium]
MASILDTLSTHLDPGLLSQLTSRLGANEGNTSKAIAAAVPLLLGALAKNASDPQGAEQLHQALVRDHDGSVLDAAKVADNQSSNDGEAILGHILGDRRSVAEQGISQASGLDLSKVGPLLTMLAPLLMGALGRARAQQGLDPQGLARVLGQEREELGARAPGVLGAVGRLLDRNHDGSALDDVSGMLGGLFGRR